MVVVVDRGTVERERIMHLGFIVALFDVDLLARFKMPSLLIAASECRGVMWGILSHPS